MESKRAYCKKASDVKSLSELNLPKDLEKIVDACGLSAGHLIEIVRKDKYLFSDDGDYLHENLLERAEDSDAVSSEDYFRLLHASYGDIYRDIKQPLEEAGLFREDDDFISGDHMVNYMLDTYSDWLISIGFCWSNRNVFMENYEEHPAFTDRDYTEIINEVLGVYKKILPPEQYSVVERDLTTGDDYNLTDEEAILLSKAIHNCKYAELDGRMVIFIVQDIVLSY